MVAVLPDEDGPVRPGAGHAVSGQHAVRAEALVWRGPHHTLASTAVTNCDSGEAEQPPRGHQAQDDHCPQILVQLSIIEKIANFTKRSDKQS